MLSLAPFVALLMGIGFLGGRGRQPDFERSFEPILPSLYRVARRLTRTAEEAEDLVGQTLYKAFRAWDSFDGEHLSGWAMRILRNEFAMTLRAASSRPELVLSEDEIDEEAKTNVWNEVSWRADAARVLQELDALPEEYRLAIQCCDVEEMSYEEAAVAMSCPVGTVRSRVSRGREMLRRRLAPAAVGGQL